MALKETQDLVNFLAYGSVESPEGLSRARDLLREALKSHLHQAKTEKMISVKRNLFCTEGTHSPESYSSWLDIGHSAGSRVELYLYSSEGNYYSERVDDSKDIIDIHINVFGEDELLNCKLYGRIDHTKKEISAGVIDDKFIFNKPHRYLHRIEKIQKKYPSYTVYVYYPRKRMLRLDQFHKFLNEDVNYTGIGHTAYTDVIMFIANSPSDIKYATPANLEWSSHGAVFRDIIHKYFFQGRIDKTKKTISVTNTSGEKMSPLDEKRSILIMKKLYKKYTNFSGYLYTNIPGEAAILIENADENLQEVFGLHSDNQWVHPASGTFRKIATKKRSHTQAVIWDSLKNNSKYYNVPKKDILKYIQTKDMTKKDPVKDHKYDYDLRILILAYKHGWVKTAVVPSTKTLYVQSFSHETNRRALEIWFNGISTLTNPNKIISEVVSSTAKIVDSYEIPMNSAALKNYLKRGTKPTKLLKFLPEEISLDDENIEILTKFYNKLLQEAPDKIEQLDEQFSKMCNDETLLNNLVLFAKKELNQ